MGLFLAGQRGLTVLNRLIDAGVKVKTALILVQSQHELNNQTDNIVKRCREYGIAYGLTDNVKPKDYFSFLKENNCDAVFIVSWRFLIKEECFNLPKRGMYVLHDSLLPKNRGSATTNWAIINGEVETGVTLMKIAKDIDAGDIADQRRVAIDKNETAATLNEKLTPLYPEIILDNLDDILNGTIKLTPQDHSQATFLSKRKPEDGRINFNEDMKMIDRLIRGLCYPYPGAFCEYKGKRVIIWEAKVNEHITGSIPGLIKTISDNAVDVVAGNGGITITNVAYFDQPDQFLEPGKVFTDPNIKLT